LIQDATPEQIDIIEQIIVYKFSTLTREEIQTMLGIQQEIFKDTQVYKEIASEMREQYLKEGLKEGMREGLEKGLEKGMEKGMEEGERKAKLETVPLLRELGMTDKKIAERLGLALSMVKKVRS
jgi:predicted transposase/invertase (TIGR01784 family)